LACGSVADALIGQVINDVFDLCGLHSGQAQYVSRFQLFRNYQFEDLGDRSFDAVVCLTSSLRSLTDVEEES
jgi:hypothetical protein